MRSKGHSYFFPSIFDDCSQLKTRRLFNCIIQAWLNYIYICPGNINIKQQQRKKRSFPSIESIQLYSWLWKDFKLSINLHYTHTLFHMKKTKNKNKKFNDTLSNVLNGWINGLAFWFVDKIKSNNNNYSSNVENMIIMTIF